MLERVIKNNEFFVFHETTEDELDTGKGDFSLRDKWHFRQYRI